MRKILFLYYLKFYSRMQEQVSALKASTEVPMPPGLMNLRNTCFLNSVLQQLYRIEVIHNMLEDYQGEEGDLLYTLKQLFIVMKKNGKSTQIEHILKKLIPIMEVILPGYRRGSQSDSFQTFLGIFNELQSKIEAKKFKESFTINFGQKCRCNQQKQFIFQIFFIQNSETKCPYCNQQFKRRFEQLPEYLIVRYVQNEKDQNYLINKIKEENFHYELQSKNIYIGDGRSGHYKAQCVYQGEQFIFNDSSVYKRSGQQRDNCLFAIYKRIEKKYSGGCNCNINIKNNLDKNQNKQNKQNKQPPIMDDSTSQENPSSEKQMKQPQRLRRFVFIGQIFDPIKYYHRLFKQYVSFFNSIIERLKYNMKKNLPKVNQKQKIKVNVKDIQKKLKKNIVDDINLLPEQIIEPIQVKIEPIQVNNPRQNQTNIKPYLSQKKQNQKVLISFTKFQNDYSFLELHNFKKAIFQTTHFPLLVHMLNIFNHSRFISKNFFSKSIDYSITYTAL